MRTTTTGRVSADPERGAPADAPARADDDLRQPRLQRAAVPRRAARRLPLRPGSARGRRRRHGRRLRPGHRPPGAGQPARGLRFRQRDGRAHQRRLLPHAAGHHRRPAGAPGHRARGEPRQRRRPAADEAAGRLGSGAGVRGRRPAVAGPGGLRGPVARVGPATCRSRTTTGRRPPRGDRSCSTATSSARRPRRRPSSTGWSPTCSPRRRPALVLGGDLDARRRSSTR